MNCKSTVEMLSSYLDRELPSEERDAVRTHLADCQVCRREERDLRSLKGLLLGVRAPEPAADFEARLMMGLREQAPVRPLFELPRLRPLVWGQLGGLATAAGLAAFVFAQGSSPVEKPREKAPAVRVANNVNSEIEAQWSEAASQGGDLSTGPPILMSKYHGP